MQSPLKLPVLYNTPSVQFVLYYNRLKSQSLWLVEKLLLGSWKQVDG